MYGKYANISGILMVNVDPYIAYIRILWLMKYNTSPLIDDSPSELDLRFSSWIFRCYV